MWCKDCRGFEFIDCRGNDSKCNGCSGGGGGGEGIAYLLLIIPFVLLILAIISFIVFIFQVCRYKNQEEKEFERSRYKVLPERCYINPVETVENQAPLNDPPNYNQQNDYAQNENPQNMYPQNPYIESPSQTHMFESPYTLQTSLIPEFDNPYPSEHDVYKL